MIGQRVAGSSVYDDPEVAQSIREFQCDWKGTCHRYPWVEVYRYVRLKRGDAPDRFERMPGWSYLCRRHFWLELLHNRLLAWKRRGIGWCYACWHLSDDECRHGSDRGPYPHAQPPMVLWKTLHR